MGDSPGACCIVNGEGGETGLLRMLKGSIWMLLISDVVKTYCIAVTALIAFVLRVSFDLLTPLINASQTVI